MRSNILHHLISGNFFENRFSKFHVFFSFFFFNFFYFITSAFASKARGSLESTDHSKSVQPRPGITLIRPTLPSLRALILSYRDTKRSTKPKKRAVNGKLSSLKSCREETAIPKFFLSKVKPSKENKFCSLYSGLSIVSATTFRRFTLTHSSKCTARIPLILCKHQLDSLYSFFVSLK